MELLLTIVFILCTVFALGQNVRKDTTLKEKRPVKTSLLSNYYEQDGNRSAVNGGLGSQELYSYSQEASIYIPVKDSSAYKLHAGVDHYSAASLTQIDKYVSAASSANSQVSKTETRVYANLSYDFANKVKHSMFTPTAGFSNEYDVLSLNGGFSYSKNFITKNISYNSSFNVIADRWLMIFPGEFRPQEKKEEAVKTTTTTPVKPDTETGASRAMNVSDDDDDDDEEEEDDDHDDDDDDDDDHPTTTPATTDSARYPKPYATPFVYSGKLADKNGKQFPVDWRYSYAFSNSISFLINKKMSASAGVDLVLQRGMLSTPFHRVYFNDGISDEYQKEVRIEKLPELRFKVALYGRYNFFVSPYFILRTQARLYVDNWDVKALTLTLEVPVKITKWLSIAPYYRFHTQSGSRYFKGYGRHVSTDDYYTSDFDLATLSANKLGGSLRFAPIRPFGISNESNTKKVIAVKAISLLYSNYKRTDGLRADMGSLLVEFEF